MPPLAKGDHRRGFVIYSRHYLDCVYPHTKPRAEELNPELKLFACPGEYEPMNFIVLPLKDLRHAKVTVTGLGSIDGFNLLTQWNNAALNTSATLTAKDRKSVV